MCRYLTLRYVFAIFIVIRLPLTSLSQSRKPPAVIAYYTGHYKSIQNYDISKLTHIIYGFAGLRGHRLHLAGKQDTTTLRKLVAFKNRHPTLKISIALGGWGGCKPCSEVFASGQGRVEFAQSALDMLNYFGADGLDLDWEYPAIPGYPGHRWAPADK